MTKKSRYEFQKDKNWKTKFRLVLLIPLLFVILYVASNIATTGSPTGHVIGTPINPENKNDDSAAVFEFNDRNTETDNSETENTIDENKTEDTDETPDETPIISGGGSSGSTTPDDTQNDAPGIPPENDNACTPPPGTEIFIKTNSSEHPTLPAEFWGTVTVDGNPADDFLEVTANMNGTLVSKTKTCMGYYDIMVPEGEGTEVIIFIDNKNAGTFTWSAGTHNEDLTT